MKPLIKIAGIQLTSPLAPVSCCTRLNANYKATCPLASCCLVAFCLRFLALICPFQEMSLVGLPSLDLFTLEAGGR